MPGSLIRRYKRFLADIQLDSGESITAHCPNPGSMLGLIQPNARVWVRPLTPSKTRTLKYAWEIVEDNQNLVGINTNLANNLVAEALIKGQILELAGYTSHRREVRYSEQCRVDFVLEKEGSLPCYVEVKNVNLKRKTLAEFPDAVTERGRKHLHALTNLVNSNFAHAVVLYVIQRQDCAGFQFASDIDPRYAEAARFAKAAGVRTLCYQCIITREGITLEKPLAYKI
jgi:sugar fermentation stimulation protein A